MMWSMMWIPALLVLVTVVEFHVLVSVLGYIDTEEKEELTTCNAKS